MTQYYTKSSIEPPTETKKEEPKSVVTAAPTVAKKSPVKKLLGGFFAEDIPTMVGNVTNEVLIPSMKKTILDMGTKGLQHLLNGTATSSTKDSGDKVSYRGYYDKKDSNGITQSSHTAESLGWIDKENAQEVLSHMMDELENKGYVEVGSYYSYAKYPTNSSDYDWGWTSLTNATIKPVVDNEGTKFYIMLPKAKPINHLKRR